MLPMGRPGSIVAIQRAIGRGSMLRENTFHVPEVTGLIVKQFFGFSDAVSDESPEKILLEGCDGNRFAFFLSAFLGHWDRLDDEAYEELLDDYADSRKVDYGSAFGLLGAKVVDARCLRDDGGTQIIVRFDRGEMTLTSVDARDPHSQSCLSFAAT